MKLNRPLQQPAERLACLGNLFGGRLTVGRPTDFCYHLAYRLPCGRRRRLSVAEEFEQCSEGRVVQIEPCKQLVQRL